MVLGCQSRPVGVRCPSLRVLALTSQVERILLEQRRIKDAERRAELELDESQQRLEDAQRELSEKLAHLRRLRQQKEYLVERGADMVARGLSNLDELERAEREETAAGTSAAADSSAVPLTSSGLSADPVPFWDDVFSEIPLDPAFLVGQGSSDGTPQVSQGSGGS